MMPSPALEPPTCGPVSTANTLQVSNADLQQALTRLRAANPGTTFVNAEPSTVPGLIKLTLGGGKLAYSDKSGRYLLVGVVFDMSIGTALDGALDAVSPPSIGDSNDE